MNALLNSAAWLVLAGAAAAGPASRLGSEILVQREDRKGFVLVDRASGVLRAGTIDGRGKLAWQAVVDTGLAGVSDVAGGLRGNAGELLAVTTPLANRVALVEIDAAYPAQTSLTPYYVGPRALSEIRSGEDPELLISCTLTGAGSDDTLEVSGDLAGGGTRLAHDDHFGPVPVLEPLYELADGPRIAIYGRPAGLDTEIGICRRAAPMLTPQAVVAGGWDFVTNARGNGGELLVVLYRVGSARGVLLEASRPIGPATVLSAARKVDFPFPVGSVVPVAPGDPNLPDGVLVTSDDGRHFGWCRLPGGTAVTLQKEFDDKPASSFLGGLLVPGAGLVRFEGKQPGGPAQIATAHQWGAGGWEVTDQAVVPSPGPALARTATMFYFDREPFTDERARLLAIESVPDWTRKGVASPVPSDVLREAFGGAVQGLGTPSSIPTHPPAAAGYMLTNQVAGGLSLAALGPGRGIFEPGLKIEPPSGSYGSTVTVTASYDETLYRLYYRHADAAGQWSLWPGSLPVAYSGDLLFVLVFQSGALATGTIVPRSYQIDTAELARADQDHDGVPDFVEQFKGLDPAGGADSDGDGVSDLEEILEGSDPNDAGSIPATRNPLPQGDGFELVGLPFSVAGDPAVTNVELLAHQLGGALLGRAKVQAIPISTLPGIGRGAWLSVAAAVPQDELVVLSSSDFFDVFNTVVVGDGREIRALVPVPVPPVPAIGFVPAGADLVADADNWIDAARTAYEGYVPVRARRDLVPADTAVAVLVESMVHAAGNGLGLLEGTVGREAFSLFPARVQDAGRVMADRALVAGLLAAGLELEDLLTRATAGLSGPDPGAASLRAVTSGVYAHHVARFGADPGLDLPLDVLRVVFGGGALPANYAGAVGAGDLTRAGEAAAALVAGWSAALRPLSTWLVEIPESSSGEGVYLRRPDGREVALFDRAGRVFKLEQERALVPGSQFTVSGFTDLAGGAGRPGMEVRQLASTLLPAASDRDEDGNLLDDQWERFFFGATGQDPQEVPAGSSYSLLQHFLEGTDPRSGGFDEPAVEVVRLELGPLGITPGPGRFDLGFTFPGSYLRRFAFHVESSESLGGESFQTTPGTMIVEDPPGSDQVRITLPASPEHPRRFYRVRVSLP